MWFFSLLRLFELVWDADERPEARRFTLGCAVIVLGLAALIGLIDHLR